MIENDQGLLATDAQAVLSMSPEIGELDEEWAPTPDGSWEGRMDVFVSFKAEGPELADLSRRGDRRIVFPVADVPDLIVQLTYVQEMALSAGLLRRGK